MDHNARPNSALEVNGCNLFELDVVSLQNGAFAQSQPGQCNVIVGQGANFSETGHGQQPLLVHHKKTGEPAGFVLPLD